VAAAIKVAEGLVSAIKTIKRPSRVRTITQRKRDFLDNRVIIVLGWHTAAELQ
jgi:hypothetical protein